MAYGIKSKSGTVSMPVGILWGVLMAFLVTVIGASIVSYIIEKEMISENTIGYTVMVLLIVSSYLGARASYRKIRNLRLPVCVLTSGAYLALLMCLTILFFEGKFTGVGVTALLVLCGGILAALPGKEPGRVGKRRNFKRPTR